MFWLYEQGRCSPHNQEHIMYTLHRAPPGTRPRPTPPPHHTPFTNKHPPEVLYLYAIPATPLDMSLATSAMDGHAPPLTGSPLGALPVRSEEGVPPPNQSQPCPQTHLWHTTLGFLFLFFAFKLNPIVCCPELDFTIFCLLKNAHSVHFRHFACFCWDWGWE